MFETLQATSRIILFLEILSRKGITDLFCGDKSHLQKLYETVSDEVTF